MRIDTDLFIPIYLYVWYAEPNRVCYDFDQYQLDECQQPKNKTQHIQKRVNAHFICPTRIKHTAMFEALDILNIKHTPAQRRKMLTYLYG